MNSPYRIMKKILTTAVAAILLLLSAAGAQAQEKRMHFGVKAGANFSTLNYNDYKSNLGYQAGIALQFDLPAWFSIEPDILFHIKGAQDAEYGRSQGLGYLEVPINLQWGPRFLDGNMRVFIQGGPYLGYAISKDIKGNETGSEGERENFSWDNINRFEYGAAVGLGIKIFAFQISAEYTWNFGTVKSATAVESFPDIFNNKNFSGFQVNLAILF